MGFRKDDRAGGEGKKGLSIDKHRDWECLMYKTGHAPMSIERFESMTEGSDPIKVNELTVTNTTQGTEYSRLGLAHSRQLREYCRTCAIDQIPGVVIRKNKLILWNASDSIPMRSFMYSMPMEETMHELILQTSRRFLAQDKQNQARMQKMVNMAAKQLNYPS